jgi:hypothetical protein
MDNLVNQHCQARMEFLEKLSGDLPNMNINYYRDEDELNMVLYVAPHFAGAFGYEAACRGFACLAADMYLAGASDHIEDLLLSSLDSDKDVNRATSYDYDFGPPALDPYTELQKIVIERCYTFGKYGALDAIIQKARKRSSTGSLL